MNPAALATPDPEAPLRLTGALDLYQVATARAAWLAHFNTTHSALVLDLGAVTGCDTAGLQLLIAAHHSALAAGRSFALLTPSPAVRAGAHQLGLVLPGLGASTP
jgi:anti-anti-sigma factor